MSKLLQIDSRTGEIVETYESVEMFTRNRVQQRKLRRVLKNEARTMNGFCFVEEDNHTNEWIKRHIYDAPGRMFERSEGEKKKVIWDKVEFVIEWPDGKTKVCHGVGQVAIELKITRNAVEQALKYRDGQTRWAKVRALTMDDNDGEYDGERD